MSEPNKEELLERIAELARKHEQRVKDDAWLCKPQRVVRGGLMRFDLLRHTMPLHQAIREIFQLEFSEEHKKATREYLLKTYNVKPDIEEQQASAPTPNQFGEQLSKVDWNKEIIYTFAFIGFVLVFAWLCSLVRTH
jgi:hypothetical protein